MFFQFFKFFGIRFIISKILNFLKKSSMLELCMGLRLELLKLFMKSNHFLSNLWSHFFGKMIIVCIFPWICTNFPSPLPPPPPSPSCENLPQNKCWVGFNQTIYCQIFTNFFLKLYKINECKYICTPYEKIIWKIPCDIFFQSCVINCLYWSIWLIFLNKYGLEDYMVYWLFN